MLRTVNPQPTLWEAILPECCLGLPAELEAVDRLLDDPVFFEPFGPHFDPTHGRPSIPMETYLRLMFLKYRYRLGYEALCREVADSISWQRFARVPLGTAVPHPTTLMKITTRCGEEAVAGLNDVLLAKAAAAKVLRTTKVRADTTVVEANVGYPTDSGLLTKAVRKMSTAVRRIKEAGLAPRTRFRDRRRAAGCRAHEIAASLRKRSEEAKGSAKRITGEVATLAAAAVRQAEAVLRNARRALRHEGCGAGRTGAVLEGLATLLQRTQRIIAQTRTRLGGVTPDGSTRLVSLHDPDAPCARAASTARQSSATSWNVGRPPRHSRSSLHTAAVAGKKPSPGPFSSRSSRRCPIGHRRSVRSSPVPADLRLPGGGNRRGVSWSHRAR